MSIEDAYIELRKVNKLQQEAITKLKEENKELKEAIKTYKTGICDCSRNVELEEENKKLKEKNNDLIEEIASGNVDIAILQKDLDLLRKAHDNEQIQRRILEQRLEKIKEYVSQLKVFEFIKEDLLSIIEGAEDGQANSIV